MDMTEADQALSAHGLAVDAWRTHTLLSPTEMGIADRLAIEGGTAGIDLMEAAGKAVADAVCNLYGPDAGTTAILCGPGNNGGDGFVAARILAERGWAVKLGLLGDRSTLTGDAALSAQTYGGTIDPLTTDILEGADIVVDAVFGAGLSRAPDGDAAAVLRSLTGRTVVAVDLPSGVSGADGSVLLNPMYEATRTVSFFRGKPGHWLLPGRMACGTLMLADIGISDRVLDRINPKTAFNGPALWQGELPAPDVFSHKYSRGSVLVVGGAEMVGAAMLAARAAQRGGAGIVTIASPVQQGPIYRLGLESAVVKSIKDTRAFIELLSDRRVDACVVGPGLGLSEPGSMERALAVLRTDCAAVVDADAITLFADGPDVLFDMTGENHVLTPHDGEFARLFPDLAGETDKLVKARTAAARAGCVVLLKGFDTVVAAPDGYAVINSNGSPYLATAGAGDVLAGLIAALMAGGMTPFSAAAAASFMTSDAAHMFGPGLIASDLPDFIPGVLERCRTRNAV